MKPALINLRHIFRAHVAAVVFTAAIVGLLLLQITAIPSWMSVACCAAIGMIAVAFIAVAIANVKHRSGLSAPIRFQCLATALALSTLQAIFILPVLICIYAPTLRS